MKFLLDQNLSRHLVQPLRDFFPDSTHVETVGLSTATDQEIWEYAADHHLVIVSKDSDFRQLAFLHGPPPKVIWLRVGNQPTGAITRVLLDNMEPIERFGNSHEAALLVLPSLDSDL